ncbi:MAG: LysE family translocator [Gammaproteobacteria bacterium]|nr:MAG: LysE family translocator [Gammaproteobacteria bacterium]
MSLELWITFVVASAVLLAVPGPTVMLVMSYALGRGNASGWATVPGVTLGDFTAMTASLLGAGAILATSATLFILLKLAGAAYLIWLGIKLWRVEPKLDELQGIAGAESKAAMFWNAYIVTALNPKSIAFFVAFVPQFVNPAVPALQQFVILETTFLALAAANVAAWAVLAGRMRSRFERPETLKLVNRTGAGFLIGAGLLTAAMRR